MNDDQRSIDELRDALGSDYEIGRQLGRGSTSTVYEAQEHSLGRSVAIKVLHPVLVEDKAARDRFELEAKAVAALNHPHVARAYRFGRLPDETPYLVSARGPGSLVTLSGMRSIPQIVHLPS